MSYTNGSGIWVYVEQENGIVSTSAYELLTKSEELKDKLGGKDTITAVLLGAHGQVADKIDTLYAYGAQQVILVENQNLAQYSPRPYAKVLTQLCEKYQPSIFLFAATALGRDVAPRVMCELRTGMTADTIDLDVDEDGTFVQTKPSYGGNILVHIAIPERRPQMVTVRPKVFQAKKPVEGAKGTLITEDIEVEPDPSYEILGSTPKEQTSRPIDACDVLVSGGRGIKEKEDLDQLQELAELLGGELACSRPLVDEEWLPHEKQIGQSGTTVKPKFILNVAISGSVQYQAGMDQSDVIMSINHTAGAPIYDVSHYGAVADYRQLIPALIAEIKRRKGM